MSVTHLKTGPDHDSFDSQVKGYLRGRRMRLMYEEVTRVGRRRRRALSRVDHTIEVRFSEYTEVLMVFRKGFGPT